MDRPRELTETEWDLIADLLETELEALPSEIHHTDASELREELRQRRRMVQDLLERIRQPVTA